MKKNKKILLTIGTMASIGTPISAVISCTFNNEKKYDLGINTGAISSLNYVKFSNSKRFAESLVEGLMKNSPDFDSPLYNYLNMPRLLMTWGPTNGGNSIGRYGYTSSNLYLSKKGEDISYDSAGFIIEPSYNESSNSFSYNSDWVTFRINRDAKWSNGDKLTASDFIDSVIYILDINTGSQLLGKLMTLGIYGAREFIDAQNEYSKLFGHIYQNPFGYVENENGKWVQSKDAFKSQNPGDEKVVAKIQKWAIELGVYGSSKSSHKAGPETQAEETKRYDAQEENAKYKYKKMDDSLVGPEGDKDLDSVLRIRFNSIGSFQDRIFSFAGSSLFLPVNKKFIEGNGGIQKFGNTASNFLTLGAFKLKSIILGANGNAILEKNNDHNFSEFTIPKSIKIFFQDDINVLGSLYEDKIISYTVINNTYLKKFWSNLKNRKFMQKKSGQGTVALAWNLDKETENNKYIFDEDFRKAIAYAVDREQLQKLAGWDSTIQKSNWTDNGGKSAFGLSTLDFMNFETITLENGDVIPLKEVSTFEGASSTAKFDGLLNKDKVFSVERARYYLDKFKRKHPKLSSVSIEYLYDTSKTGGNIGIGLQNLLGDAFGGYVNLELKAVPVEIFNSYISEGKFQLIYKNFDYITSGSSFGAIMSLMIGDGIRKSEGITIGFRSNPVGSWTIGEWLRDLSAEEINDIKNRHNLSDENWNDIIDLTKLRGTQDQSYEERVTITNNYISKFFSLSLGDEKPMRHQTVNQIMNLIVKFEKLIVEASPVIPLFTVDTKWVISRIPNFSTARGDGSLSLSFAYDVYNKPRPDLPGEEALS